MNIEEIVNKFIEAINRHDVDAIGQMMSQDCVYIDSDGTTYDDLEQMKQGWPGYFKMFPDYKIEAPEYVISGDTVILLGTASGTYTTDGTLRQENHWHIPAAWKAVVVGDKIKLWQWIADNSVVAKIIEKEQEKLKDSADG
ncbi:MAG: nuclear transport factor 2 family protein [Sedimentisphaerales bacterium]|nr:nuclear transport factor 2 family protein [Sedimentisphaerales bacterium]